MFLFELDLRFRKLLFLLGLLLLLPLAVDLLLQQKLLRLVVAVKDIWFLADLK